MPRTANKKHSPGSPINVLIPSGCTMINLCCSDLVSGAFKPGSIVTIPGKSSTGKTMLAFTILAAAAKQYGNEYQLIYDHAEAKLNLNLPKLFGSLAAAAIKTPRYGRSKTIQNFEQNIAAQMRLDMPCVYILDSLDSLSSDEEIERTYKSLLSKAKTVDDLKKIDGSFKTEKAIIMSQTMRIVNTAIEDSKSLLVILQQAKKKFKGKFERSYGRDETTAGGVSPEFYSMHRLWLNPRGTIPSLNEKIGNKVHLDIDKNHYTGKLRSCDFRIYTEIGIDNIGCTVDWLVEKEYWPLDKQTIIANELDLAYGRDKLIRTIENNNLESELAKTAQKYWNIREDNLSLKRKPRFQ